MSLVIETSLCVIKTKKVKVFFFSFSSHETGLLFFQVLFNRSGNIFQRHHKYNKFNPVSDIVKPKDKQISEIINIS